MAWFRAVLAKFIVLVASVPANADVKLSVSYSQPADLYSMMDNVSGWLDGFVIPAYREEWEARFGWSKQDQIWADRYSEYRRRTFIDEKGQPDPLTSPDGIFASASETTAGTDALATYFLAQPDINSALGGLNTFATSRDAKMLRGYYRHFEAKWRVLLKESAPLTAKAETLEKQFDGKAVNAFIQRVSRFYGAQIDGEFKVFFTRHPPGKESSAEPLAGRYMLLHAPISETGDSSYWDTIVMHEFVHYISSRQTDDQKRALTQKFLKRCEIPANAKRLWLFEEPLAVAWGQAAYSEIVLKKPMDTNDNWYGIPWVDVVARAISPSIIAAYTTDASIDGPIADEAADRCNDLKAIAATLNTK